MAAPTDHSLSAPRPLPGTVKAAVQLMRTRFGEPLTVAEIATACGVAERTLNEQFRKFLGRSPGRYLQQLRLAEARERLQRAAPGATVAEVARSCGFHHLGRFARQYRDCFGEPPSRTLRAASGDVTRAHGEGGQRRSRVRPSVVVVPLRHAVDEAGARRMALAVAEDLASSLCEIGSIDTRWQASASSMTPGVAAARRASYLLTGSVTAAADGTRIVLQLVEVASGRLVWSERLTGREGRASPLDEPRIGSLRRTLVNCILEAEIARANAGGPGELDAHELGMRALDLISRSRPDATRRALELLESSVARDPDDALSTALAAWAHSQLVLYSDSDRPEADRSEALDLNRRAALLDEGEPLVLTARSAVHTMAGEFAEARALVTRALARDPTSGWAWGRSGWLRAYDGDYQGAIADFGRALRIGSPHGVRANALVGLGTAHFGLEDYASAARCLRRAMRENPGMWWANRSLSVSLARLGQRRLARGSLEALRRHAPGLTVGAVVASVPFDTRFLNRLGEGLADLGLPA